MADPSTSQDLHEKSIGELLEQLSEQTSTLVSKELELAKAELAEKGKKAGLGAGMFGAAGLFGLFAFGALTTALIAVLGTAVDLWLAALIVTVVYAAIAGVVALRARSEVRAATPPMPEQAIESTKEDVEWAKEQAKSART
jgi:uncharacterized membrane protein YqjE